MNDEEYLSVNNIYNSPAQANSLGNLLTQAEQLSNIQYRMQGGMLVSTFPDYPVMNPVLSISPTVLLLEDI